MMFLKKNFTLFLCLCVDWFFWLTHGFPVLSCAAAWWSAHCVTREYSLIALTGYIVVASSAGISLPFIVLSAVFSWYVPLFFHHWVTPSKIRDALLVALIYSIIWFWMLMGNAWSHQQRSELYE